MSQLLERWRGRAPERQPSESPHTGIFPPVALNDCPLSAIRPLSVIIQRTPATGHTDTSQASQSLVAVLRMRTTPCRKPPGLRPSALPGLCARRGFRYQCPCKALVLEHTGPAEPVDKFPREVAVGSGVLTHQTA